MLNFRIFIVVLLMSWGAATVAALLFWALNG